MNGPTSTARWTEQTDLRGSQVRIVDCRHLNTIAKSARLADQSEARIPFRLTVMGLIEDSSIAVQALGVAIVGEQYCACIKGWSLNIFNDPPVFL